MELFGRGVKTRGFVLQQLKYDRDLSLLKALNFTDVFAVRDVQQYIIYLPTYLIKPKKIKRNYLGLVAMLLFALSAISFAF